MEVGFAWQPLCGGAGSQGEPITLPSFSVRSFPLTGEQSRGGEGGGELWARGMHDPPPPPSTAASWDTAAAAR